MRDLAPIIALTGEFITDAVGVEAFVVLPGKDGGVKYRLIDWDAETCMFTAATPKGEEILKARGVAALRDVLLGMGEELGE